MRRSASTPPARLSLRDARDLSRSRLPLRDIERRYRERRPPERVPVTAQRDLLPDTIAPDPKASLVLFAPTTQDPALVEAVRGALDVGAAVSATEHRRRQIDSRRTAGYQVARYSDLCTEVAALDDDLDDHRRTAKALEVQRTNETNTRQQDPDGVPHRTVRRHKHRQSQDTARYEISTATSARWQEIGIGDDDGVETQRDAAAVLESKAEVQRTMQSRDAVHAGLVKRQLRQWSSQALNRLDKMEELTVVLQEMQPRLQHPEELTVEELEDVLDRLGVVLSDEELAALLHQLDPTGRGRVRLEDFRSDFNRKQATQSRQRVTLEEAHAALDEAFPAGARSKNASHRPLPFNVFMAWLRGMGAPADPEETATVFATLQPATRAHLLGPAVFPQMQALVQGVRSQNSEAVDDVVLARRLRDIDDQQAAAEHAHDVFTTATQSSVRAQRQLGEIHQRLQDQSSSAAAVGKLLPTKHFYSAASNTDVTFDDTSQELWDSVLAQFNDSSLGQRCPNIATMRLERLERAQRQLQEKSDEVTRMQVHTTTLNSKMRSAAQEHEIELLAKDAEIMVLRKRIEAITQGPGAALDEGRFTLEGDEEVTTLVVALQSQLKQQSADYRGEVSGLIRDNSALKARAVAAEQRVEMLIGNAEKLQDRADVRLAGLEDQVRARETMINERNGTIRALEAKVAMAEDRLLRTQGELTDAKEEIVEATAEAEDLQRLCKDLVPRAELEQRVVDALSEARIDMDSLREAHDKLTADLTQCRRELHQNTERSAAMIAAKDSAVAEAKVRRGTMTRDAERCATHAAEMGEEWLEQLTTVREALSETQLHDARAAAVRRTTDFVGDFILACAESAKVFPFSSDRWRSLAKAAGDEEKRVFESAESSAEREALELKRRLSELSVRFERATTEASERKMAQEHVTATRELTERAAETLMNAAVSDLAELVQGSPAELRLCAFAVADEASAHERWQSSARRTTEALEGVRDRLLELHGKVDLAEASAVKAEQAAARFRDRPREERSSSFTEPPKGRRGSRVSRKPSFVASERSVASVPEAGSPRSSGEEHKAPSVADSPEPRALAPATGQEPQRTEDSAEDSKRTEKAFTVATARAVQQERRIATLEAELAKALSELASALRKLAETPAESPTATPLKQERRGTRRASTGKNPVRRPTSTTPGPRASTGPRRVSVKLPPVLPTPERSARPDPAPQAASPDLSPFSTPLLPQKGGDPALEASVVAPATPPEENTGNRPSPAVAAPVVPADPETPRFQPRPEAQGTPLQSSQASEGTAPQRQPIHRPAPAVASAHAELEPAAPAAAAVSVPITTSQRPARPRATAPDRELSHAVRAALRAVPDHSPSGAPTAPTPETERVATPVVEEIGETQEGDAVVPQAPVAPTPAVTRTPSLVTSASLKAAHDPNGDIAAGPPARAMALIERVTSASSAATRPSVCAASVAQGSLHMGKGSVDREPMMERAHRGVAAPLMERVSSAQSGGPSLPPLSPTDSLPARCQGAVPGDRRAGPSLQRSGTPPPPLPSDVPHTPVHSRPLSGNLTPWKRPASRGHDRTALAAAAGSELEAPPAASRLVPVGRDRSAKGRRSEATRARSEREALLERERERERRMRGRSPETGSPPRAVSPWQWRKPLPLRMVNLQLAAGDDKGGADVDSVGIELPSQAIVPARMAVLAMFGGLHMSAFVKALAGPRGPEEDELLAAFGALQEIGGVLLGLERGPVVRPAESPERRDSPRSPTDDLPQRRVPSAGARRPFSAKSNASDLASTRHTVTGSDLDPTEHPEPQPSAAGTLAAAQADTLALIEAPRRPARAEPPPTSSLGHVMTRTPEGHVVPQREASPPRPSYPAVLGKLVEGHSVMAETQRLLDSAPRP